MNILAIGNSFSQDATRYLNQIAKSENCDLTTVNLYIGGCPLSKHYKNMIGNNSAYSFEFNGEYTGLCISIKDALLSRDWDCVTFQQASFLSVNYETYQPYLSELSAYVKKCAPEAKQIIHQTWAYEQGSARLTSELGYNDQSEMYNDIKNAYEQAAKSINAEFIIPSGTLFQNILANGIPKVHRDTFHASLGLGRYALGLLWYSALTGKNVENNSFSYFDEQITAEEISIIKKCVSKTLSE